MTKGTVHYLTGGGGNHQINIKKMYAPFYASILVALVASF